MELALSYTPWKHQKTSAFMFSGGIKRDRFTVLYRDVFTNLPNIYDGVFSEIVNG